MYQLLNRSKLNSYYHNLPGKELYDTDGELVCVKPFPSMPIYFGNDPDGAKYRKAYFDKYDGECLYVNVVYNLSI